MHPYRGTVYVLHEGSAGDISICDSRIRSTYKYGTDSNEKYSSKYDDVNVEEILNNPRLRNQYVNCAAGSGPCITGEAKFLKEVLPEVLVTTCRKCTEKQQLFFDKVITWFNENDKETWDRLVAKIIQNYQKPRDRRG
ncbi:hypothetical protein KPH14_005821 [Odynerus spinipes]|uniref:Uncharacterized protein n=1 Tax=Odynerus spinipes TaxID=1348599 RepID=A0AAD9RB71_9HYME|nr:hypothetical protein KPH14_005821 [Odynerus spinipes]